MISWYIQRSDVLITRIAASSASVSSGTFWTDLCVCLLSALPGLRLTSVFSTPDYITPETPQVANEFDEDEVESLRFFPFLSVGICHSSDSVMS